MIILKAIKAEYFVFAVALILYLALPNTDQGMDSYVYALNVRNLSELIHPHHLLYNVVGVVVNRLFSFAGLGSLRLLSLLNSMIGAIILVMVFRTIKSKTDMVNALSATALLGSLYSFWYYSTSVEVNMPAILFASLALGQLSKEDLSNKHWILSSLAIAMGSLFHQTLSLLYLPLIYACFDRYRSVGKMFKLVAPGILSLMVLYAGVAFWQASEKTIDGTWRWITYYSHLGAWGKLAIDNCLVSIWGIAKTLWGGDMIRKLIYLSDQRIADYAYLTTLILTILLMSSALAASFTKGSRWNFLEKFLLSAAIIFGLFAFWWAPTDDGFWLYSAFFMVIYAYLRSTSWALQKKILILLPLVFVFANYPFEIIPSTKPDKSIVMNGAEKLAAMNVRKSDLVITNFNQIRLALDYHYGIKTNTACLLFAPAGNKDEVIKNYKQQITNHLKDGRVFIFSNELDPEPHRRYLLSRFERADYLRAYGEFLQYLVARDSFPAYGQWVVIFEIDRKSPVDSAAIFR